jgi:hypothetical protein
VAEHENTITEFVAKYGVRQQVKVEHKNQLDLSNHF